MEFCVAPRNLDWCKEMFIKKVIISQSPVQPGAIEARMSHFLPPLPSDLSFLPCTRKTQIAQYLLSSSCDLRPTLVTTNA
jgi:hypothetical protein